MTTAVTASEYPSTVSAGGARQAFLPRFTVPLEAGVTPPPGYYAAHLRHVAEQLLAWWPANTRHPALSFAHRLLSLPEGALRLYARLEARRGPLLREDQLAYEEVGDLSLALKTLATAGLLERNGPVTGSRLLGLLNKAELKALFPEELARSGPARKDLWIEHLLRAYCDATLNQRISACFRWCELTEQSALQTMKLAYFGNGHSEFAQFVLESLGMARPPVVELSRPDWLTETPNCLDLLAVREARGQTQPPAGHLSGSAGACR